MTKRISSSRAGSRPTRYGFNPSTAAVAASPPPPSSPRPTRPSSVSTSPMVHANGGHWGRCGRTIVEGETDDGRVGLGELGGGGEAATAAVLGLKPYLVGRDPARLEGRRFVIANPTEIG